MFNSNEVAQSGEEAIPHDLELIGRLVDEALYPLQLLLVSSRCLHDHAVQRLTNAPPIQFDADAD